MLHLMMGMPLPDLQRYPSKFYLVKNEEDIVVFPALKASNSSVVSVAEIIRSTENNDILNIDMEGTIFLFGKLLFISNVLIISNKNKVKWTQIILFSSFLFLFFSTIFRKISIILFRVTSLLVLV